eukprot:8333455-Pyramimonas_sp.AAC.1
MPRQQAAAAKGRTCVVCHWRPVSGPRAFRTRAPILAVVRRPRRSSQGAPQLSEGYREERHSVA